MKPPIGFVLVTYNNAEQTLFLCEHLTAMFDKPPIVIHHDFSKSPMNTSLFSKNVRFVENWLYTEWGSLTVMKAQQLALRTLYATADPDWFVPLSTSDYPIQTADCILEDLFSGDFDAYMDSRPARNMGRLVRDQGLGELSFRHPIWPQLAYNRYVAIPLLSRKTANRLHIACETFCLPFSFLIRRYTPFGDSIKCHGGDSWFTANRKVAHLLFEETPLWRELHEHYRKRIVPEESLYHTLLGNTPGFKVSPDNKRYTDWRGCYAHPRTLTRADFPRLLSSNHHFARKFTFDPEMLQDLSEAVAHKGSGGHARSFHDGASVS
jgi:hypothetical protein